MPFTRHKAARTMGTFMNLCGEKFKSLIFKYVFHVICLKMYGARIEYLFVLFLELLTDRNCKQNHQANMLVQIKMSLVCWKEKKTQWLQLVSTISEIMISIFVKK